MSEPTRLISSFALNLLLLTTAVVAAEPTAKNIDPFALDGSRNILQEEHFGIVNGKITAAIPYRHVLMVGGLWAPPLVSSNFQLDIEVQGARVATDRYTWHPFFVERAGTAPGVKVESSTMLVPGARAGLMEITFTNVDLVQRTVPIAITVGGTLDIADPVDANGGTGWSFATPKSKTATSPKVADGALRLEQGKLAIVLRASGNVEWHDSQPHGRASLSLPAGESTRLLVAWSMGPAAEAEPACKKVSDNPEQAVATTHAAYAERVDNLFHKLPRLESPNAALVNFYNRSLVSLLMNRWDVPEFLLNPYYSTGSVNGGCVGNYLWDFGENWEIFPLLDPDASKTHIRHFVSIDITKHFAFEPTKGTTFGPWYPVNQEKIIGLIYYYVKQTGDTPFLQEVVSGKSILQHAIDNALFGDDLAKPVALIDYGPSNSHLELRRGIPYNHIMPDLNGRRYENYQLAAQLADLAGKPMPQLRQRADELKTVLKQQLWNEQAGWFEFQNDKGKKDLRYTVQVFKLFGSRVLDADQQTRLLQHLNNEQEFMAEFGMESMAKTDLAYDPVDYDNGGGGCFTAFPAQIAERLYKAGHAATPEKILQRTLWWGERVPYWGDSFACNEIQYRRDTPLQSTFDAAAVAQCIIFGMFGVWAEFNGDVRIHPQPPKFAPQVSLNGLKLRGHLLDIVVADGAYEVRKGTNRLRAAVGQSILVQGDKMTLVEAPAASK